jgi:PAS domain S-box-containing protein
MQTEQLPELTESQPGYLKQVEDALRASDDRLRDVLDSMFAFVLVLSTDGRVLDVNRAPLDAACLRREDVIGFPFAETYWWSHSVVTQKQLRNALRRAAEGATVREDFLLRIKEGHMIVIDATFGPLCDVNGCVTEIVGSAVDVSARKEPEESSPENFEKLIQGTETVLLVEDRPTLRGSCVRILKECGYTVLAASDGEHAIEICKKHYEAIQLLLTDVVMPGIGGRQLAERLVTLYPRMKVLYMSGYTHDAVLRHGVEQAEVHFLQKPFSSGTLAKKVREVLATNESGN